MATMKPEKKTRTTVDTIVFTRKEIEGWASPPFQRELRVTEKVRELSEEIVKTAVIPGVLTLGKLGSTTYLLDGQHRRAAFILTEHNEGYADIRVHSFDTMADMGAEFVKLNTALVRLKPDDVLRGMEGSSPPLKMLREKCAFIGYDSIRRNQNSPVVSMSQFLRAWMGSRPEVPQGSPGSALHIAQTLLPEEAQLAARVGNLMFTSWGRTEDAKRLWGSLNLVMVCWLYRRLVVGGQYAPTTKRFAKLTDTEFGKCLMSLAASEKYSDWLAGRIYNERNRSPAYHRVKEMFAKRLTAERGTKPLLPQPAWAANAGRSAAM